MDFHSISSNPFGTKSLTTKEKNIIIEALYTVTDERITFLALVETLKEKGEYSAESYRQALRYYRRLTKKQKAYQCGFVCATLNTLTFDKVIAILKDVGCTKTVRVLDQERFGRSIGHMNRVGVAYVNCAFSYYQRMKKYVDNSTFVNTDRLLQLMIDKATQVTLDKEIDICRRQKAAERIVPLYVLLLQQHRTRENRIAILDAMKEAVPRALDTTSVDSVYHSKRAITEAIAGHHDVAIEHARRSAGMCSNLEPCFASILSAHDHQYVHRQIYMETSRDEHLREVLRLGDQVVNGVQELEDIEVQNQWKRLVLLFQVLSLLRITSLFKVPVNDTMGSLDGHIGRINDILKEVRYISLTAEVRREMIYSICMARFKELTGDLVAAMTYQDEAVRLANDGGVFSPIEKSNIEYYLDILKEKQETQPPFVNTEPVVSIGCKEPVEQ